MKATCLPRFLTGTVLSVTLLVAISACDGPVLAWNTFVGTNDPDPTADSPGFAGAVDTKGCSYLVGYSSGTWGTPVRPYEWKTDAYVAKFDRKGNLVWNTFLGGPQDDQGRGISVDASSGNIYVAGFSGATWGTPVRAFQGEKSGFVAKLDKTGKLLWNTFQGGSEGASSISVSCDDSDNVYVSGGSDSS